MDGYAHVYTEHFLANRGEFGRSLVREDVTAGQATLQWHFYTAELRLGVAPMLVFQQWSPPENSGANHFSNPRMGNLKEGERNLRIRFGPPGTASGIQIGWMPYTINPDAALFGDYLIRIAPFPGVVERPTLYWDSLGSLSPILTAMRLSAGEAGSPLRGEALLIRQGSDYSWLGTISGKLGSRMEWGLALMGYRALGGDEAKVPTYSRTDSTYVGLPGVEIDSAQQVDTVFFTHIGTMASVRAAYRFGEAGKAGSLFAEAALLGWRNQAPTYADRLRRIAVSAGVRIAKLGWLDDCVAQAEWRRSPTISSYGSSEDLYPVWGAGVLLSKRPLKWLAIQAQALTDAYQDVVYAYRIPTPNNPDYAGPDERRREYHGQVRIVFLLP